MLRLLLFFYCIFFLWWQSVSASTITYSISDATKRSIAYCEVQKNPTISSRPVLDIYGTTKVVDFDDDNDLDGDDIQHAISIASRRYKINGWMQRVVLAGSWTRYLFDETIIIPSWVVLDGSGNRLLAISGSIMDDAIRFDTGTKHAWVYDVEVRFNSVFTRDDSQWYWIVNVWGDSSYIYVYDNLFVNDKMNVRDSIGNTDNNVWVHVWGWAAKVYIDSNRFSNVPAPIKIAGNNTRHIKVTHNLFYNWRVRAIYVPGAVQPIHHLTFSHNKILPPLTGSVRQPIAFQANQWAQTYKVTISNNYIEWNDTYHYARRIDNDDGTRTRITTDTNGTADMISLHNVRDFVVVRNCIINGGELWIAVSQWSEKWTVINNYIYRSDVWGIALWAGKGEPVHDITIQSNKIIDPARNRQKKVAVRARWWIVLINATEVKIGNNLIKETERNYLNTWVPYTMAYGMSLWQRVADEVTITSSNRYELPGDVVEYAVSR